MNKNIIVPVVLGLLVGIGVGFFSGIQYQKSQGFSYKPGEGNAVMMGPGGQRMMGGGNGQRFTQGFSPTIGEIISADENSITVKMEDGSSKIVLISETTAINKTDPGSKADLAVGTKVGVFGTDNNGTITAQNIQINPQQMRINNSSPSASAN